MTLERAIVIATKAHAGQSNRYGQPYIFHPFRVMMKMNSDDERIVAVLHDVLEKSDLTTADLEKEGFSMEVTKAVDCLTRRDTENDDYFDYIERVRINPLAKAVKLADVADNSKAVKSNMKNLDAEIFDRYQIALEMLK